MTTRNELVRRCTRFLVLGVVLRYGLGVTDSRVARAQGTTTPIAMSGQASPDGNGQFSTFNGRFSGAFLNAAGQVSFLASIQNTAKGSLDDSGLFRGDGQTLTLIAHEDQPTPDGNGQISELDQSFGVHRLNSAGQLAFVASLRNTSGGTTDNFGLFTGSGGSLIQIVRLNQVAPDANGRFRDFGELSLNAGGQVAFNGALRDTRGGTLDDDGVFRGSGNSITQIARGNQSASDGNGHLSVFRFPVINRTGQTAFISFLHDTAGGIDDHTGIFRGDGGPVIQIARQNQTAPDGNGRFHTFAPPFINARGEVSFFAYLSETNDDENDDEGLYRGAGGTITQIARAGQSAPDGNGEFDSFNQNAVINARGQLAFGAGLRNTTGNGVDNRGIFRGDGETTTQIVRSNAIAPDGNGRFGRFLGSPQFNDGGQVAFVAPLTGTAGGVSDDRGLFLADGRDIVTAVRKGDTLSGGVVSDIFLYYGSPESGGGSFNDLGQVAYTATFTNGTQGIYRFTPELHYRNNFSGSWENLDNWTLTIPPSSVHDVRIDPTDGVTVSGPSIPTTVRSLVINARSTGVATLTLDGTGEVTVTNGLTIQRRGRLRFDNALRTPGGLSNGGEIELTSATAQLSGGSIIDSGLILGTGHIENALNNTVDGEVRVLNGQRLLLGDMNGNLGKVQVLGATVEFNGTLRNSAEITNLGGAIIAHAAATNDRDGLITGRGLFRFDNGLTNEGTIAVVGGITDVFGDITNAAGSRVISTGGGITTFFGDVIHNGAEIRTSADSKTVFLGSVTGSGSYTGTGSVFFEGDMRPGNSPAEVLFGGDAHFGRTSSLEIEIGGPTPGNGFDSVVIAGAATLDGTLNIHLLDGFLPAPGNTFTLLSAESVRGVFSDVNFPEGQWQLSYGGDDVTLVAVPEPSGWLLACCVAFLCLCWNWRVNARLGN